MGANRRKWTDEQLRMFVARVVSMAKVLRELGLKPVGGNYRVVGTRMKELGLDTLHWTRKAQWQGNRQPRAPRIPLESVLRKGSSFQSHKLRKRLIEERIFEAKCSRCGLTEWIGQAIPLELDHIDGDSFNHEVSNLRLVCPNCHALTPTYRGRNVRRRRMLGIKQKRAGYLVRSSHS